MYRYARINIFACLLIVTITCHGQVFTVENGSVVYESSAQDADSSIKKKYSLLSNSYINKYCSTKKMPMVYLVISKAGVDTSMYELAYDNLMGNSTQNKDYERNKKYDDPGIRIKIYSADNISEDLLKLLTYAINNLKELKKIRRDALKKDYYDQPNTLSLSAGKIKKILKKPTSDKIKKTVSEIETDN